MFDLKRTGAAAFLGGAMVVCATAADATPSVATQTQIFFGNDSDATDPGTYADSTIDPQQSTTGAAISSQYSGSFTAQNAEGSSQTMQVDASSKASAQFGQLKASSTLSLATPFANTAANAPYTNADYTSNPSGTPDFFESFGSATFHDTLSLDSTSPVTLLRLTFHLDGSITDNNLGSAMAAIVSVYNPDTFSAYYNTATQGTLDTTVNVDIDVTDPNAIDVALGLEAESNAFLDLDPLGYSESGTYQLDADFYDTLALTGITGFDANGDEVTLNGLTGSSGTNYLALVAPPPPSNGVPEPATLALVGAGLAGLRWRRRR